MFQLNYLSPFLSSSGMILKLGSFKTSLLAILLSNDRSKEGNSNKLASIAKRSVAETKAPKATVPPKLDIINTSSEKSSATKKQDSEKRKLLESLIN